MFHVNVGDTNGGFGGTLVGSDGNDALIVNDSRATVFIGLHDNAFLGGFPNFVRQHDYGSFESLTYNTGAGNDAFSVFSTAADTPITINAGAGDDTATPGALFQTLTNIRSNVRFNGQEGSDTLAIADQATAAAQTYTVTAAAFTRSGIGGPINYGTTESVNIGAGSGRTRSTSWITPRVSR